jgi:hypothetical protein
MGIQVHSMKYNRHEIEDSDRLDSIGLSERSTIFLNSPVCTESYESRQIEPDTTRRRFSPDQIAERIGRLEELGFHRSLCEKALRSAGYEVGRAADFLVSGYIPEGPVGASRVSGPPMSARELGFVKGSFEPGLSG